jgi:hypothetical protein
MFFTRQKEFSKDRFATILPLRASGKRLATILPQKTGLSLVGMYRGGILGHQFDQKLESLLLADFTENHTPLWFFPKSLKKFAKKENSSLFMDSILYVEWKTKVENQTKTRV